MPVVRVSWFSGKDAQASQAVAAEITESIVRNTGTDPNYIYVVFVKMSRPPTGPDELLVLFEKRLSEGDASAFEVTRSRWSA